MEENKKNKLKEFFKPTQRKVFNAFILAVVFIFIVIIILMMPNSIQNYFSFILSPLLLFFSIPFYFIFFILIFLPYIFGCYISKKKKWAVGIVLYLITSLILSGIVFYGINSYNERFGLFCEVDSDCHYIHGKSVGINYISLDDLDSLSRLFATSDSVIGGYPVACKNGRCGIFYPNDARSIEDCERPGWWGIPKSECYHSLTKRLNDTSLCNNLEEGRLRDYCLDGPKTGW